jgi:hypothetical protein
MEDIVIRVREAAARPIAVGKLSKFLIAVKKERNYIQKSMTWVSANEVQKLTDLIDAADAWLSAKQEAQKVGVS